MAYSSTGAIVDITGKVDASGHLRWTAPAGSNWTLYGLFLGWHGKMVERAAPGAEGNVIDHFSATALRKILSADSTRPSPAYDLSPLRCFLQRQLRSATTPAAKVTGRPLSSPTFQRHHGYDLREHLPALFGHVASR